MVKGFAMFSKGMTLGVIGVMIVLFGFSIVTSGSIMGLFLIIIGGFAAYIGFSLILRSGYNL